MVKTLDTLRKLDTMRIAEGMKFERRRREDIIAREPADEKGDEDEQEKNEAPTVMVRMPLGDKLARRFRHEEPLDRMFRYVQFILSSVFTLDTDVALEKLDIKNENVAR